MLTMYQGTPANWVWDNCPETMRVNKIVCPVIGARCKDPAGTTNPYQKPLALYWELLKRHTRPGDVVVELTGGSGTLAAACACHGEFVDRSGRYC